MQRGALDQALAEAERLVGEHPNFRLAQLVYGDLLLARAGSITSEIPGRKLPDLYGAGAFPISYPNEWDRMRGRTVVIAERVEWMKSLDWQAERDMFLRHIDRWREDWESRDSERYLSHYAARFRSDR